MKKAIRCFISCILPCGALDVIRIVHTNGRVEEISGRSTIKASEIMIAHPKHVLKKPSSPSQVMENGNYVVPKAIILPPEAELQRGKIYFLMPLPPSMLLGQENCKKPGSGPRGATRTKGQENRISYGNGNVKKNDVSTTRRRRRRNRLGSDDQYLSEILSEKISTTTAASHKDRSSRGRFALWRPHLDSICESPTDASS